MSPTVSIPPFEKHCNYGLLLCSDCDMKVHFAEIFDHSAFKKKGNEDSLFVFEVHVREVHVLKDKRL